MDSFQEVTDIVLKKYPVLRYALRTGLGRAFLLFWLGRNYKGVVTCLAARGAISYLWLETIFGRRKRVIILEFIRSSHRGTRRVRFLLSWILLRPALHRSLALAQVLTEWEGEWYSDMFNVERSRFVYVPWPIAPTLATVKRVDRHGVMVSGRAAIDWETFFQAARTENWEITIVCKGSDVNRVKRLARGLNVNLYCEVPHRVHWALLEKSCVYVLPLQEEFCSSGQVRVQNAIDAGVPVVATGVRGLEGYLVDQKTALVVKPGDYEGLRKAIARILNDEGLGIELVRGAREFSSSFTKEKYKDSLLQMVKRFSSVGG